MPMTQCRECKKQINSDAQRCPHCGAPRPARAAYTGTGFEWKSKQTIYGFPLVHIAFGRDSQHRLRIAKGVIAIGQFVIAYYGIAQAGIAEYLWCPWNPARQDAAALAFFENLLATFRNFFHF